MPITFALKLTDRLLLLCKGCDGTPTAEMYPQFIFRKIFK